MAKEPTRGNGGSRSEAVADQADSPRPRDQSIGVPAVDQAVERAVNHLLDNVVDKAVLQVGSATERRLVREGVASVLRSELRTLADREAHRQVAMLAPPSTMAIGDGAQAGMNVAKQVKDLGFVEFTAGLITGTFDAIIGATIKQMDAYAKLVRDIAKTLAEFQAENVSAAQVSQHLVRRYPDGKADTVVRADYQFTDKEQEKKPAAEQLKEVVAALIAETRPLEKVANAKPLTEADLSVADGATQFTQEQVDLIRPAIAQLLASDMLEHLRAMAREGMARIVITDGHVASKLTFNVTSTENDLKHAQRFESESAGVYLRGSAWAPWGNVTVGGHWNRLRVNTVNESSFDALTMNAQIIGEVRLNLKTETFAPAVLEGR